MRAIMPGVSGEHHGEVFFAAGSPAAAAAAGLAVSVATASSMVRLGEVSAVVLVSAELKPAMVSIWPAGAAATSASPVTVAAPSSAGFSSAGFSSAAVAAAGTTGASVATGFSSADAAGEGSAAPSAAATGFSSPVAAAAAGTAAPSSVGSLSFLLSSVAAGVVVSAVAVAASAGLVSSGEVVSVEVAVSVVAVCGAERQRARVSDDWCGTRTAGERAAREGEAHRGLVGVGRRGRGGRVLLRSVRRRDGAGGVRAGLGDLGRLGRGDGRSGGGLDGGHRGEGCAARATQGVQRGSVTGGACS